MEKSQLTYSIAIRTLGTGGEKYRILLESITTQTLVPERVVVYIAEGYDIPNYRIGKEEYVVVPKGMAKQRILPYQEISSDCILLLDDDLRLNPQVAKTMLEALQKHNMDCVGCDIYQNQNMTLSEKIRAILVNGVFPRANDSYAFKVQPTGSFSYNNNPQPCLYESDSCAGAAAMWKRETFLDLHLEDELWLEELSFPYGEDLVTFHKLAINGFRLGIDYGVEIEHMDGKTSSGNFKRQRNRLELRTKAQFIIWWRCFWQTTRFSKTATVLRSSLKLLYLFVLSLLATPLLQKWDFPLQFLRGLKGGWQFVHTPQFKSLRPYQFRNNSSTKFPS